MKPAYDILLSLNGHKITISGATLNNILYMGTVYNYTDPFEAAWHWYQDVVRLPSYQDANGKLGFNSRITGKYCELGTVIHNYDWVPIESLMNPFVYLLPVKFGNLSSVNVSDFDPNYKPEDDPLKEKKRYHMFCYLNGEFVTTSNMSLNFADTIGIAEGYDPVDAFNRWYVSKTNVNAHVKSYIRDKEVTGEIYNFDWFPYVDLLDKTVSLVELAKPDSTFIYISISHLIVEALKFEGLPYEEKFNKNIKFNRQAPPNMNDPRLRFIDEEKV